MSIPLRKLWRNPPKQYGPSSVVQIGLFNALERIGIDPAYCALAMPMWGSGDQVDYSKNGTPGINNKVAYKNNSLYFKSSSLSNYIELPSIHNWSMNPGTWHFMFTAESTGSYSSGLGYGTLISNNKFDAGWHLGYSGDSLKLQLWRGGASVVTIVDYPINTLLNTIVTYDGSTIRFYKNGNLTDAIASTGTLFTVGTVAIGCGRDELSSDIGENYWWDGQIHQGNVFDGIAFDKNQITSLSENPWQLWQPYAPTYFSFAASSGITLSPIELTQSQSLSSVVLTQKNTLSTADLAHTMTVSTPVLSMASTLIVNALNQTHALSTFGITQKNTISLDSLTQAQTIAAVELAQANLLSVAGLSQGQTIGNVTLDLAGVLTVANLLQSQSLSTFDLTQAHDLAVNNITQAQDIGSVDLALQVLLEVYGLSHTQAITTPTLTITNVLTVDNLGHVNSLGTMTLTQAGSLLIDNLQHDQSLSAVSFVTAVGKVTISFSMEVPGVSFDIITPNITLEME